MAQCENDENVLCFFAQKRDQTQLQQYSKTAVPQFSNWSTQKSQDLKTAVVKNCKNKKSARSRNLTNSYFINIFAN